MKPKAVILLSGGLDSAVTLHMAAKRGFDCHCLLFDYGQRHKRELHSARRIARRLGAISHVVKLDLPWKGSSLTDRKIRLPKGRTVKDIKAGGVPSTYVPSRNTVFLSLASSLAEEIGAGSIFIGAHYEDSSGYPDCRAGYLKAFNNAIKLGTRAGLENKLSLEFPLIKKNKSEIIRAGANLGVPFELTWSCYSGGERPCGECDSCILRAKGFKEAGLRDPLLK